MEYERTPIKRVKSSKAIHIGDKVVTSQGYIAEVEWYQNASEIYVRLNDKRGTVVVTRSGEFRRGEIPNPFHRSVFEVGYLGEEGLYHRGVLWKRESYNKWSRMMERTCSRSEKERQKTYEEATVCTEWENYSNFHVWYIGQVGANRGWQLDKDILVKGNKHYSPNTCRLVPQEINTLLVKRDAVRGKNLIGVYYDKTRPKTPYRVYESRSGFLGRYETEAEAFAAYKAGKERSIKAVAEKWRGEICEDIYVALIKWEVEESD